MKFINRLCIVMTSIIILSYSYTFAETLDQTFQRLDNFIQNNMLEKNKSDARVILGSERLLSEYSYLIDGKKIGLVTNQTAIDSNGISTINKLKNYDKAKLVSLYSPEHGIDGKAKAGDYVKSYIDKNINLPVYSLYGDTRKPTPDMLKNIDVLIFEIQDIGSRTYTYMSTLNYVMKAAHENNIPIIVLDRPNPLGANIVEGPVVKDKYITFVGVDNLALSHGMTAGELAMFFNRKIGSDLTVIPMLGYTRDMTWGDTGLKFVQTSPYIPDYKAAFLYMATGMGETTGIRMSQNFSWVGGPNLDSNLYADKLNLYGLKGVYFKPAPTSTLGGVKVVITDEHTFNPAMTGIYTLMTANSIRPVTVLGEKNGKIPMFEKLWGGTSMSEALLSGKSPDEFIAGYQSELEEFKNIRSKYLIYK